MLEGHNVARLEDFMLAQRFSVVFVVLCAIAVFNGGCGATIGPAPAKLSAEVGDRISEMQGVHQLALKRYFESERKRIETFLHEKWIPLFLKNALGQSRLMKNLEESAFVSKGDRNALEIALKSYLTDVGESGKATQEIVDSVSGFRRQESENVEAILRKYVENDNLEIATQHVYSLLQTADPAYHLIEWVTGAQVAIERRKKDMLQPLDEAERTIAAELAQAYADVLKANGVVTARLEAAAEVTTTQDSLLKALGAKQYADTLRQRLAALSSTVGNAIEKAEGILNLPADEKASPPEVAIKASAALVEELQTLTNGKSQ